MQEQEFQQKNLSKISKFRIFKSQDSEEVIEGKILNPNDSNIKQEEYIIQNNTKGKELRKGILLKGKLEVMLDKYNYDKLVLQNENNKSEHIKNGLSLSSYVDMFELVETQGLYFIVKL